MSYLETVGPLDASMGSTLVDKETQCAVSWGPFYPVCPRPGMRVGWRFFNESKPCGDGMIVAVGDIDPRASHGPAIVVLWSIRPENDTLMSKGFTSKPMTGFSISGKGTP